MPPEPTPRAPETKSRFPLPAGRGREEERTSPAGKRAPERRRPRIAARAIAACAAGACGRSWSSLLVVNYWVASTIPDKPARAHIAYSPQFLHEVQGNNVSLVTITEQKHRGRVQDAR